MFDTSSMTALMHHQEARVTNISGKEKAMNAAQAEKVAQEFESLFLAQMIEQMFGESLGEETFGSRETEDIYKALMVEEYGKQVSRSGGIGIADYVKRELLKLQEEGI